MRSLLVYFSSAKTNDGKTEKLRQAATRSVATTGRSPQDLTPVSERGVRQI
jgi:hypothetical protein